ncbi:MAG: hypothetical protein Q9162_005866 [Coniocarpon cinnabarinum]
MFIGTPHEGSELARVAEFIAKVSSLKTKADNNIAKHLQPMSEYLKDQRNQYSKITDRFQTLIVSENLKTKVGPWESLIVSEPPETVLGNKSVQRIQVKKNHVDMVRFSNQNDEAYSAIIQMLKIWTMEAHARIGRLWKLQEQLRAGNIEDLLLSEQTSIFDTFNEQGIFYAGFGKYKEAEAMYQRALQGKEKAWGPEHTSTLDTVNNLGILYRDQGKLAKAEEMYQRALAGKEKALGSEARRTFIPALTTAQNLAILLEKTNRFKEAKRMYTEILPNIRKVFGNSSQRYQAAAQDLERVQSNTFALLFVSDTIGCMKLSGLLVTNLTALACTSKEIYELVVPTLYYGVRLVLDSFFMRRGPKGVATLRGLQKHASSIRELDVSAHCSYFDFTPFQKLFRALPKLHALEQLDVIMDLDQEQPLHSILELIPSENGLECLTIPPRAWEYVTFSTQTLTQLSLIEQYFMPADEPAVLFQVH